MTRPRDNQRQRVYDAEPALDPFSSKAGKHMLSAERLSTGNVSIPAVQTYVDDLCRANWFQSRWGRVSRYVRHKAYGRATGGGYNITLPPWGRQERVILHELAHTLTPSKYAAHGPEFAGVLLTLVQFQLGAEARRALRAEFTEHRVRVSLVAVPDPGAHRVVTATERAAKVAVERQREVTTAQREVAADILRRAAAQGLFGPAGRKPRVHALEAARRLTSSN